MKRIGLFSILCGLVISLAAPTGAAFALEEEPPTVVPVEQLLQVEPEPLEGAELPLVSESEVSQQNLEEDEPLTVQVEPPPQVVPPIVEQPPVVLPVSPLIITAYKASGAHLHAVQLYNNSSSIVPFEGLSMVYGAGGSDYEIPLSGGWVEPRSYVVVAWQGESDYADVEFSFPEVGEGALESISLYHTGYQPLTVTVPVSYNGELLHRFKSSAGNYTTNTTFAVGDEAIHGGGLYRLPDTPDISVLEVLVNPRSCTIGFETADCYDYIKLRNDGATPLDLSLYRLRSGYSNTSSTSTNTTYFNDVLLPSEVRTLSYDRDGKRVSLTANDGTVWLEDHYGYTSFDLAVPPYVDSDLTAQVGRSWAYNSATDAWQWATPSPETEENNFVVVEAGKGEVAPPELVPCAEHQYRSEETNRCRNIAVPTSLTPCREGQYRSEETNRCRSIATAAAAVLKPCADDQFRNPLTNRCKKIASSEDIALADCGEGRERNPLTNRCRNVLGASVLAETMPFPVEKMEEGSERFVGWWTIGLVTLAGIGYGMWEWRDELRQLGQRAGRFVGRGK